MVPQKNNSLQFKLALDDGLKKTWEYLSQEYEALDKASIVRLALNNLAKELQKKHLQEETELFRQFDELERTEKGMTEDEFALWWNKNKKSI